MSMRALIKAVQATKSKKPNFELQLQLLTYEITDKPQAPARSVKTNCPHFTFPIRVFVMKSGVNFIKPSPCSAISNSESQRGYRGMGTGVGEHNHFACHPRFQVISFFCDVKELINNNRALQKRIKVLKIFVKVCNQIERLQKIDTY